MADDWLNMWNDRYQNTEYAYGEDPNEYLKEQLQKLAPGTILFGAEGEGRNAIFAARSGWTVSAFDISVEGRKKALQLAEKNDVAIDYKVGYLPGLNYKNEEFDALSLIYAHFPPDIRSQYFHILDTCVKKGGTIIFEAFSRNHIAYRQLNEKVGGPNQLEFLFSIDEIRTYFKDYEIVELVEKEVMLNEGLYHIGKGSVIRFLGRKR